MVARDHLRGEIPMASIHPNPFIADRSPSPDDGISLALSCRWGCWIAESMIKSLALSFYEIFIKSTVRLHVITSDCIDFNRPWHLAAVQLQSHLINMMTTIMVLM